VHLLYAKKITAGGKLDLTDKPELPWQPIPRCCSWL